MSLSAATYESSEEAQMVLKLMLETFPESKIVEDVHQRLRKATDSKGNDRLHGSSVQQGSWSSVVSIMVQPSLIYLKIYLLIYLFIYVFMYLCIYLFIYLSIYLFIYLSFIFIKICSPMTSLLSKYHLPPTSSLELLYKP